MSVSRSSLSQRKLVHFNGAATVEELYRLRSSLQTSNQMNKTHKSLTIQQPSRKISLTKEALIPRKEHLLKEYYSQTTSPQVDSVIFLGGQTKQQQSRFYFSFTAKKRKVFKPPQTSQILKQKDVTNTNGVTFELQMPCEKLQIFSKNRGDLSLLKKKQKQTNIFILIDKKETPQFSCKSSFIEEPGSALNGWKTSLNLNQIWEQQYW